MIRPLGTIFSSLSPKFFYPPPPPGTPIPIFYFRTFLPFLPILCIFKPFNFNLLFRLPLSSISLHTFSLFLIPVRAGTADGHGGRVRRVGTAGKQTDRHGRQTCTTDNHGKRAQRAGWHGRRAGTAGRLRDV